MTTPVTISKPKKSRNELKLPQLHFVVADDWIDKLGKEAFCAWIKLHTYVDRRNKDRDADRIPYSLESLYRDYLKMSKSKFYRTVVRPLWNYGLIDMVEYPNYKKKGKHPVNIVVYESPCNDRDNEVKPLIQIRDYDREYKSVSQAQGKKGGRPRVNVSKIKPLIITKIRRVKVSKLKPIVNVLKLKPNHEKLLNINYSNNNNKEEKNDVVVVSENKWVIDLIKERFNHTITEKTVKQLLNSATKYKHDLREMIENTYQFSKTEKLRDVIKAIRYAIKIGGYDIDVPSSTPEQPTKNKNDIPNLPDAVRRQLEEKENKQEKTAEETAEELAQLEENRKRIQAKLKAMREKRGVI